MINGCRVEELSAGDDLMLEKFAEGEIAIKISDLQRLKVCTRHAVLLNLFLKTN